MNRNRRFWLIYAVAWLPYAVSYVAIFMVQSTRTELYGAVTDMLYSVVSAALLGLGVLWLCRRLPWTLHRRPWFFAVHVVAAALYSLLWLSAVVALLTAAASLQGGQFLPFVFSGYSLQWQFFAGLMIYGTLASVSYVLQVADRLRQEEARAARADILRARAELEVLRAQLNPHFLFNTLHTLMALVRHNPAAAEQALERFAALLRYTLNLKREAAGTAEQADDVTLADEWKFVQNYLALEGLRLDSRLRVEADVDADALSCTLPAFTLQPLVENAIQHAIAPRAQGGVLHIAAHAGADDTLHIEVRDDGPGASAGTLSESKGMGLRLVRQRLETRYDGQAGLRAETPPGGGFMVIVRVPQDSPKAEARKEALWEFAR